jgi:hypothetical protein
VAATNLDFTDNLPAGTEVAAVPNTVITCTAGTFTAAAGSSVITYTGGTVNAASSCNISVDITGTIAGTHDNLSGDLTSSLGNSGPANARLTVIAEVLPPLPVPGLGVVGQLILILLVLVVFRRRYLVWGLVSPGAADRKIWGLLHVAPLHVPAN